MKSSMLYCAFAAFVLSMFITLSAYSQCDDIPIPVNPQNGEICEGNVIPALTVDNPSSEYQINWYSEITEGTLLASATNSYIPVASLSGEYIYYAETEEIGTGCKSDRIPVNLVIHQNPEVTIIPNSYFCCPGGYIDFEQSSSSNVVSFFWSFEGAAPSTSNNASPESIGYFINGIYNVELTIEDANGCINSDLIEIFVSDLYAGINGINGPICFNTPAFNLTADIPGGVWSGTGITDSINGTFDPSITGVGMQLVFYQVTNGPDCSIMNDFVLEVYDENVFPEITPVNSMFADEQPVVLTSTFTGGVWSGAGIIDAEAGIFDPSVAGIGLHTISYYVEFGACSGSAQTVIEVTGANVLGYIYNDANDNCVYDAGEGISDRMVVANPGPFYAYSDEDGMYRFYLDEGTYNINLIEPDYFEVSCPESGFQNVTVADVTDSLENINLGLTPVFQCSSLNIDIAIGGISPCFSTNIYVEYSNIGSIVAEDAYVEVELSPVMTYVSGTIDYSSFAGYTYRYDIGSIAPFESGSFTITADVDCNTNLVGQTGCVTANIFPIDSCEINYGDWDFSEIDVNGSCADDINSCFTLLNSAEFGVGDMQIAREFRIYANDTLVHTGTFQLAGGASTEICWASNGSAIRLEADQHPEHPYSDFTTQTVEGCGDANGTSYGYITTNTYGDEAQFVDIDCQIITSSYDPNNKEVQPSGISENHYIESNTLLTYRVNFQNTGTDTAFTVVIVDTLSSQHDILSFERGLSSHPYEFEIYGNGILVWTFNNILLPDSAANEPESHGFVTYKVRTNEMSAAEYGTQILNNAAIYFDFNPPVITNTTELVFWNLPLLPQGVLDLPLNLQFSIFPNPATQSFSVDVESTASAIEIFDTNGKAVKEITNYNSEQITISDLSKGLYFVKLINGGKISVGKLVVE